MASDFRETTLRVTGAERVIRTERKGTVKHLEAAHTKAVKAALLEMRKAAAPALRDRPMLMDRGGNWVDWGKQADRWERGTFPSRVGVDVWTVRRPFPKVRFTEEVPADLIKIGPTEYATMEAAASMGVGEIAEEVLPGLFLRRFGIDEWALAMPSTADDYRPDGYHVGTLFAVRKRARQVAVEELSIFDWTRTADEMRADELLVATVQVIRWREQVARKPSDILARDALREAREALEALSSNTPAVAA
ncbi:hypothetical protein [Streptomyces albipurpureus]|uniref:Uncharacterized protein n=1 Tax=Streptomyces albipurpureus TaxID=2897419 RepID=A0ABT0UT34_9ACTN|nr:hypothetical protein [Streptomyces sp. CWNU-1]MCM2391759.1 hypothetical protein [Streptomyces sp. CWNU-1]